MPIRRHVLNLVGLAFFACGPAHADTATCAPVDFTVLPLVTPHENAAISSILIAYPDAHYSDDTSVFTFTDGATAHFEGTTDRPPQAILRAATIGDQFRYLYPLDFDLSQRTTPWNDPGRVRNEGFMRALYFDSKSEARKTLAHVKSHAGRASFSVTRKNNVACQLQATLDAIGDSHPKVFKSIGGSFNWRKISGTDRLSVHSFGAAVDLNTSMGGYWKWQGAPAGNVGAYGNQIPQPVVEAFERFGFIWGGKWHHFDGMHFEYRPELIIYSRLHSVN